MEKLKALSLFSGIGGIDLALNDYAETIAFCEQNSYCQKVLNERFPNVPIFNDVKNINKEVLKNYGKIDIIHGGFPCQDISIVGSGKGLAGERSGLFYEICRIANEIRPTFIFLENVPAIRTRGLKKVAQEFIKLRYDCRWLLLSADKLGGPQKRQRWFLLAYNSERKRKDFKNTEIQTSIKDISDNKEIQENNKEFFDSNSTSNRLLKNRAGTISMGASKLSSASNIINVKNAFRIKEKKEKNIFELWNKNFTDWDRMAHGISSKLDENFWRVKKDFPFQSERLHALGNSVIPAVVTEAFERLIGIKI